MAGTGTSAAQGTGPGSCVCGGDDSPGSDSDVPTAGGGGRRQVSAAAMRNRVSRERWRAGVLRDAADDRAVMHQRVAPLPGDDQVEPGAAHADGGGRGRDRVAVLGGAAGDEAEGAGQSVHGKPAGRAVLAQQVVLDEQRGVRSDDQFGAVVEQDLYLPAGAGDDAFADGDVGAHGEHPHLAGAARLGGRIDAERLARGGQGRRAGKRQGGQNEQTGKPCTHVTALVRRPVHRLCRANIVNRGRRRGKAAPDTGRIAQSF